MTKKYFKRFLESKYYYDYRKEVLKRLAMEAMSQQEESDTSSELSWNRNSIEDDVSRNYGRRRFVFCFFFIFVFCFFFPMNIQTYISYYFRSSGSLRIGHLDELGFFVNDSDNEIDHDICKIFLQTIFIDSFFLIN